MEPKTLLIRHGTVLTLGQKPKVLPATSILVRDGLIIRMAADEEIGRFSGRILDASGMVVMPGFINAHTHFYSAMACGIGGVPPAGDFSAVLRNLWWPLDRSLTLDHIYYSTLTTLLQAIRHGVTAVIDHHAGAGAISGSLDRIASAVEKTGVRACLCYEVSDRDGEAIARKGLEENVEFLKKCRRAKDSPVRGLFGLHASFTLSDSTLKQASRLGQDLQSGFHIHAAESVCDQDLTLEKYGCRVIERLHRYGILGPQSLVAHCVHIDENEKRRLADSRTMAVHNPQSNLNNAVGICDLVGMQQAGILIGLGTDGMTMNMTEEMRVALWAQRLHRADPSAGFTEVVQTLLQNNALIARRIWGVPLGELTQGASADIICVPYQPVTPLTSENLYGHILYGLSQMPVDTTIVDGTVLMHRRKMEIDLGEEETTARSRELAEVLWKRMQATYK